MRNYKFPYMSHVMWPSAIRTWREEHRVGLRQFAKAIGVSPTYISKMERKLGLLPGKATIRKIAEFFGKNPDELLAMADKVASDVLVIIRNRSMPASCGHRRTSPKSSGRP
jgi:transcriptional regulator with XRE-family HTH domain